MQYGLEELPKGNIAGKTKANINVRQLAVFRLDTVQFNNGPFVVSDPLISVPGKFLVLDVFIFCRFFRSSVCTVQQLEPGQNHSLGP